MTFFSETISVFTAKISDELFLSHWPGFSDFPFLLPDFPYLLLCSMSYMTLSSQEQPLFQKKNSFMTPFLLCSYFRAHPTTLLLKIFGGRMHGPSLQSSGGSRNSVRGARKGN